MHISLSGCTNAQWGSVRESFSTIPSLKSAGGEICTWAIDIKNAFKEFYLDFHSSTSSSTDEIIRTLWNH